MATSTTAISAADDTKTYQEMDVLDEKQIAEEINGHILDEYFYTVNGKWGLSYAGVKAVAFEYAKAGHPISVEHVEITESPDGFSYRAIAVAKDLSSGEKRTGAAEVERWLDPDTMKKPRPFAYTQAGSKAQRNAIRHFLPETVIQSARAAFEEKSKPKDVTKEAKVSKSFVGSKPVDPK